ncbi:MAG: ATP-binding cassette domain-containing protein [Candidatus Brocadia sp. AMX2]|uniref:ABC transporter ATP-binding protein n=1 Tax=Candidatus Brocadia sinica JPN1 TaxID=1197129 RepID=A0ABQ0K0Z6_9BACT|nr:MULTISPECIES: ABC transporter ATP-binding protein [Brocadia]MBC6933289.1 ATP-binding cassette domain-containing protein [Candidatus Brocadia sp.]MBL1170166.1 ATP-binding cassette domain-containing protein [Candidatus Brocadia sp. AMX1]MCK6469486.1 ATP-binding cassette domain-containing protein [Candidatus Brocadia sinica]NOG42533.1 ATP-binding cassette domain-containing protein [Planctomycetota bacterium]KAA0242178.1 MAG: ATP-binding cassette domain-containing protein [Candidatus Brocadia s
MARAIIVSNLNYCYPDGTMALKDVNFDVEEGETLVIIGANGTGKSTLFMNLMGILEGDGRIEIMGLTLDKKNMKEIRRKMGLVFQNPDDQLFCPTVMDDVSFGPLNLGWDNNQIIAASEEALVLVGMEGYGSRISHHLSFGEKKRAAIATVLSMNPKVLLLDEPTSGLDPRSSSKFINILYTLKSQGKTLLVVTHDIFLTQEIADRVLVFSEEKRPVAIGNYKEILNNYDLLLKNNLVHQHRHRHDEMVHEHEHRHGHIHKH